MSDEQLPIAAIVGGSVGGIVAIIVAILLFRYIRRARATPRQLERPKDLDLLMERPPSPRKQPQTLNKPSRKSSLMPTPYTYSNTNHPAPLVTPTSPTNTRPRAQEPSQGSNPTPSATSTSGKPSKHQPHSRTSSTGALKKSSSAKPYISPNQPSPTTSTEQMIPSADRGERSPRPSTGGSRPFVQATPEREKSERERHGRVLPPAPYPAEKSDLALRQTPLTDASLSQAIDSRRPLPQPAGERQRRQSTGSRKEKSEKADRPMQASPWPNEKATPLPGTITFPSAQEEKQAVARSLSLGAVKPSTPATPFPTAAEEKRMLDTSLALAQSPLPVAEDLPGVRQRSNSAGARRPLPHVPVSPGLGLGGAALNPGAIVVVEDKPTTAKLLKRSSSASSLRSRRASVGNRSSTTFEIVPAPPMPPSPLPPPLPTNKPPLKSALAASATNNPTSDNPYLLPASRPLSPFDLPPPATPTTPTDLITPTQPPVPHNSLHINAQNFPYPPPPIPPSAPGSSRRQTAQSNAHYSFSALSPSLLPIPLPPTPSQSHPPSHSRAPSAFNGSAIASGSNSRAPSQYFPATPHTFASSQLASPTLSEFESLPPPWAGK